MHLEIKLPVSLSFPRGVVHLDFQYGYYEENVASLSLLKEGRVKILIMDSADSCARFVSDISCSA